MLIAFYTTNPQAFEKNNWISEQKIKNLFDNIGLFKNEKFPDLNKKKFIDFIKFKFISLKELLSGNIPDFQNNMVFIIPPLNITENKDKLKQYLEIINKLIKDNINIIFFNNEIIEILKQVDYIITDTNSKNGDIKIKNENLRYKHIYGFFNKNLIDTRKKKFDIKYQQFYLINIYSIPNKYKYWIFKHKKAKNRNNEYVYINTEYAKELIKWIENNYKIPLFNENIRNYYKYNLDFGKLIGDKNLQNYYEIYENEILTFLKIDFYSEILKLFEENTYTITKYQKKAVKLQTLTEKIVNLMLKEQPKTNMDLFENLIYDLKNGKIDPMLEIFIENMQYLYDNFNIIHDISPKEAEKRKLNEIVI